MSDQPIKQVIVIRRDLKMRRGKEIVQGSHASLAFLTSRLRTPEPHTEKLHLHTTLVWSTADRRRVSLLPLSSVERAWIEASFRKVCLQVPDEEALLSVYRQARDAGLEAHLIQDNGITEFGGTPTYTSVAIGPDFDEKIDVVTGNLELY